MPLSLRSQYSLSVAGTALLLAAGNAANADVTAAEVWQNMNAPYAGLGLTMNSTPQTSGNTTVYTNNAYGFVLPLGAGGGTISIPDITLTENGDGTVTISYPEDFDMLFSATVGGAGSFSAMIDMTLDMSDSLAKGTPGDITYTYSNNGITASLGDVFADGEMMDDIEFDITIAGRSDVETRITEGNLVTVTSLVTSGEGSSTVRVLDPLGTLTMIDGTTLGGTAQVEMALPMGGSDILNLAPAFEAGMSFAIASDTLGGTNVQTTSNAELGLQMSRQESATGASRGGMTLDASGLSAIAAVADITASITDQTIPLPINFTIAGMEIGYDMPIMAGEAAQPFGMQLLLDDLAIDDGLWGMIDFAGQMDRSPFDFGLDIAGTAILTQDLPDFMTTGMMLDNGMSIGTLESLEVRSLDLGALGATASADANFTFDNSDMFTYPGFPKPVGVFNFTLNGLNQAIDQLVSIGLMSPEDTFGMRMMMGMVATPTGDDSMAGTIELDENGGIVANGQRLR